MLKNYVTKQLALLVAGYLALGGITPSFAQLSGPKVIPGDYPTIAAAIADLNLQSVGAGGVTFNVIAGHTETASNLVITATGTATDPIIFQKVGSGANPLITAGTGVGSLDGIIILSGSDYVTFNRIDVSESASNTTNTTRMEWGYAMLKANATDGCHYNTIQNCSVTLDRASTATVGIWLGNHTTATSTSVVLTAPSGSNSYNRIYGNTVSNTHSGIMANGYLDATPYANYDQNNELGGMTSGTGNTVMNFAGGASTAYGIRGIYQNNLTVANNTINNTAGGGINSSSTLYGIQLSTGVNSSASLSSNFISISQGSVTSTMYAISSGFSGTGTVTITNNLVRNCASAGSSSVFYGIYLSSTPATAIVTGNDVSANNFLGTGSNYFIYNSGGTGVVTISSNTVTNNTTASTGSIYAIYNSCSAPNITVNSNTITLITRTGTSGTFYAYYNIGSPTTGNESFSNNTITNISQSGTSGFNGFYSNSGSGQSKTITGNTISGISAGSGISYCVYSLLGSTIDMSQNSVFDITTAGTLYGLYTTGVTMNAGRNLVHTLTSSGGNVVGAYINGGTTQNYFRNKIYNLNTTFATGVTSGFHVTGAATTNISNNLIGDLRATGSAAVNAVNGINVANTVASNTINIYYNTISLNASGSGANFGTSGINTTTAPTVNLRNNIVVNNSTALGTGLTVAFRRSSATNSTLASTSNNNLYYAGVPSPTNVIHYDGTNAYMTLTNYKTFIGPNRDSLAVTENVPFLSQVGSSSSFLHINPTAATNVESGAAEIAGFGDDYDAVAIRAGYPLAGQQANGGVRPDIGADEGDFMKFIPAIPNFTVTTMTAPATGACYSNAETLTFTIENIGSSHTFVAGDSLRVNVTGAATQSFVVPLSGTVANGANISVSAGTVNMTAVGTYSIRAIVDVADDPTASNDTLYTSRTLSIGTVTTSVPSVCAGSSANLTIAGHSGSSPAVQWQSSVDGVIWVNEIDSTNTFSVTPADTMMYRALVCGNNPTNAVTVEYINPAAPSASNVTRCGAGPVAITATGTGTFKWYDVPTGGLALASGSTFNTTVASTDTFYVESLVGGVTNTAGLVNNLGALGTLGNFGSANYGLQFSVNTAGVLNHVYVYPAAAGNVNLQLYTNAGVAIGSPISVPVSASDVGQKTLIPLNISLTPGTYRLLTTTGVVSMSRYNPYNGGYPQTGSGGAISVLAGLLSITGTPSSTTYYFFFDWNYTTGCTSPRTAVVATVDTADAITVSASTAVCAGGSANLSVSSSNTTYTYTWSPATGLSGTSGAAVVATPSATTTYTVSASDASSCLNSGTTVVVVNPLPELTVTSADSTVCLGSSVQLNVSTPATLAGPVGTGTTTNSTTTYPAPYGNRYEGARHQFLITATDMSAAGYSAGLIRSLAFDVTNTNNADSLVNFTIKMGATALGAITTFQTGLNQVASYSYHKPTNGWNVHTFATPYAWDGVSNVIIETCFNNGDWTNNASVNQTTTSYTSSVWYRADNPTVCGTNTVSGTLSRRPNMRFGIDNPTYTYVWTPAGSLSSASVKNPMATPTGATTYSVTVTDTVTGCSSTGIVPVDILSLPTVAVSATDSSFCPGSSTTLNATGVTDFTWSPAASLSAATGATVVATPAFTTTYTVTGTGSNGCTNEASLQITVEPAAFAGSLAAPTAVCPGTPATLQISGSNGNVQWYSSVDNITFSQIAGADSVVYLTPALTDTIFYGAILTLGNCADTTTVAEIGILPGVSVSASATDVSCFGMTNGQAVANVTGTGTLTYSWNTVPVQTNDTATGLPAGNYTVVVTNTDGCTDTASAVVNEPAEVIVAVTGNPLVCDGTSTTLSATGATTYSWSSGETTSSITVSPTTNTTYIVTGTTNGCSSSDTIDVAVDVTPVASFTYNTMNGLDIDFTAGAAAGYVWNFGDGNTGSGQTVSHSFAPGTYIVQLIVSNACGADTITQTIVAIGTSSVAASSKIALYPNPSKGAFTVEVNGNDAIRSVSVLDVDGRVVANENVTGTSVFKKNFDLSTYAKGVYSVRIISDAKTETLRFILN